MDSPKTLQTLTFQPRSQENESPCGKTELTPIIARLGQSFCFVPVTRTDYEVQVWPWSCAY